MKTLRRKNQNKPKTRPEGICNQVLSGFPNWKKIVQNTLGQQGKAIPEWPSYVFAPIASYIPNVVDGDIQNQKTTAFYNVGLINQLAALVPWSLSKGVYKFSQELLEELIDSQLPEILPSDVLKKLPQWSIYIELPTGQIQGCYGFFTFLESDNGRDELRILLDYDDRPPVPFTLFLDNCTIHESLDLLSKEFKRDVNFLKGKITDSILDIHKQYQIEVFKKILPLVLYICSENAEISGSTSYNSYKQRQKLKNNEFGQAPNVSVWDVGLEIGTKLRQFRHGTQRINDLHSQSKMPHLRKAHWHHFWTGNKESKNLVVRWLSPIPVNFQL
ncbi:AcrVA2 family anti-CRISPR protein [Leptospira santarosai]|uniref:Uncharacterized protein n=1 Tax=Leptospira santarosai str. ZUN179 TaxID=1049985 RepID=M6UH05_9LEPT|nr:hypothetical protein [Leptospira santarosai]EMO43835.1 hypothetical protein LEP1GSC187_0464 [Leptospira santarosai str. ZUN179]